MVTAEEDRQTVVAAVREVDLPTADASLSPDAVAVLVCLAQASAEAAAAAEAALAKLKEPQAKLPVFGLGGCELVLLAIAAAIARPRLVTCARRGAARNSKSSSKTGGPRQDHPGRTPRGPGGRGRWRRGRFGGRRLIDHADWG